MRWINNQGKVELLTDEIQEIIGKRLHWLVRKGNFFILFILGSFLIFSWKIDYPEIIKAPARLYSANPPAIVVSKFSGHLDRLYVQDGAFVTKDQYLACIESSAVPEEVFALHQWINQTISLFSKLRTDSIAFVPAPALSNLGEIQPHYQNLLASIQELKQYLPGGIIAQKQNIINQDRVGLKNLLTINTTQLQYQYQDRVLKQKELSAYDTLAKDKVIAPLELNQFRSQLLNRDQSIEQLNAQRINLELSYAGKQKELIELKNQARQNQQHLLALMVETKAAIEGWLADHIARAPKTGRLVFTKTLTSNMLVEMNQPLFQIIGTQDECYVTIEFPESGLGKLAKGQKVLVIPNGYPQKDFGQLEGIVNFIPAISADNNIYLVRVQLIKGLRTNRGKQIEFRNGLNAEALVMVGKKNMLSRILGPLYQ